MGRDRASLLALGGFLAMWLFVIVVPPSAQAQEPDPRFDVNFNDPAPVTLVKDASTGAIYARIRPRQPWVDGPPLDPSSAYFTLQLDVDGVMTTLGWEMYAGEVSVDAASDMGIVAWSGYVLRDGSIVVWLPLPEPNPDQFWLDIEIGMTTSATDPGAATTYGGVMTTDSAEIVDLLFGDNYPIWDLGGNTSMAAPITSGSDTSQSQSETSDSEASETPATTPPVSQTSVAEPPGSPEPAAGSTDATPAGGSGTGSSGLNTQIVILVGGLTLAGLMWWFVTGRRSKLEVLGVPVPLTDDPIVTDEEVAEALARTAHPPTGDADEDKDLDALEFIEDFLDAKDAPPKTVVEYDDSPAAKPEDKGGAGDLPWSDPKVMGEDGKWRSSTPEEDEAGRAAAEEFRKLGKSYRKMTPVDEAIRKAMDDVPDDAANGSATKD